VAESKRSINRESAKIAHSANVGIAVASMGLMVPVGELA
jgi:hypothetical protein